MEAVISPRGSFGERRFAPRLNLQVAVRFREVLTPQKPFVSSVSMDLSARGMGVETAEFLPKNARLVLLFSLPDLLKPVRAICRVAWVRERPFGGGCEGGLEFIEMVPEDREAVAACVERGTLTQPRP